MAANLPEQFADVATDGMSLDYSGVRIRVRREIATLSRAGQIVLRKDRVLSVTQPDLRTVNVTFEDGASWAAHLTPKKKGCGCG